MDFVTHFLPKKSEAFFLRFSKVSTVAWASALIVIASLSRNVPFVLNAAFSLRGLTSGALLGGLILAIFWKTGRPMALIAAMLTSLAVLTAIQVLPTFPSTVKWWNAHIGTEIYWPWYTLIGVLVTLGTAAVFGRAKDKRAL